MALLVEVEDLYVAFLHLEVLTLILYPLTCPLFTLYFKDKERDRMRDVDVIVVVVVVGVECL